MLLEKKQKTRSNPDYSWRTYKAFVLTQLWHETGTESAAPGQQAPFNELSISLSSRRAAPLTFQMVRSIKRFNELRQTNARCMAHWTIH